MWQVSLDWVQSWQSTPPIPQAVAVVPLLQLPPVSQHPAHDGQGAEASAIWDVDELELDVELVVLVVLLLALALDVRLELDAVLETLDARELVLPGAVLDAVAAVVFPVALLPSVVDPVDPVLTDPAVDVCPTAVVFTDSTAPKSFGASPGSAAHAAAANAKIDVSHVVLVVRADIRSLLPGVWVVVGGRAYGPRVASLGH